MKYLTLSSGKVAIVDDDDYEWLSKYKWSYSKRGYAVREVSSNGKSTRIYMHRLINKTPRGYETDHISQDKLDNRKINLRTVTRSQNMHNLSPQKNNTSGYRGVSWHSQRGRWTVRCKIDGKYKSLGMYDTPEEASKVYLDFIANNFS